MTTFIHAIFVSAILKTIVKYVKGSIKTIHRSVELKPATWSSHTYIKRCGKIHYMPNRNFHWKLSKFFTFFVGYPLSLQKWFQPLSHQELNFASGSSIKQRYLGTFWYPFHNVYFWCQNRVFVESCMKVLQFLSFPFYNVFKW